MNVATIVARVLVVVALLLVAVWVVRRGDGVKALRRNATLQVVGSTRVGKGAAVTVVRIGGQAYALGVTDNTVTMLTATEIPTTVAVADTPAPARTTTTPTFAAALTEQLSAKLAGGPAATATRPAPPTTAQFVRSLTGRLRGTVVDLPVPRVLDLDSAPPAPPAYVGITDPRTDLLDDTLLEVLGMNVPAPDAPAAPPQRTRTAPARTTRTRTARATEGTVAAPAPRIAGGRSAARMDAPARQDEEHPWNRSCRQRSIRVQRAPMDRETCVR